MQLYIREAARTKTWQNDDRVVFKVRIKWLKEAYEIPGSWHCGLRNWAAIAQPSLPPIHRNHKLAMTSRNSGSFELDKAFSITSVGPIPTPHRRNTFRRLFIGPTPENWSRTKKGISWLGQPKLKEVATDESFNATLGTLGPAKLSGISLLSDSTYMAKSRPATLVERPQKVEDLSIITDSGALKQQQEEVKPWTARPSFQMEPSDDTFVTADTEFKSPRTPEFPHPYENPEEAKLEEFQDDFADLDNVAHPLRPGDKGKASIKTWKTEGYLGNRKLSRTDKQNAQLASKSKSSPIVPRIVHEPPSPDGDQSRSFMSLPISRTDTLLVHSNSAASLAESIRSGPSVTPHPVAIDISNPNTIIRKDLLLVRKETTDARHGLPQRYNEGTARKMARHSVGWREFEVVLRPLGVEFYSSSSFKVSSKRLDRRVRFSDYKHVNLSLYSSLDRTIALTFDTPGELVSDTFIFKARTPTLCDEWYMLFWRVLPHNSEHPIPPWCNVNVPDIDIRVRISLPDDGILSNETNVTAKAVKETLVDSLKGIAEWEDVLEMWERERELGLCWKRFDRLEWIAWETSVDGMGRSDFVIGPQRLEQTHELELRPIIHEKDYVRLADGTKFKEPAPVEGYLIRLTAHTGNATKSPKRQYYSTHDQFLFRLNPFMAVPPPSFSNSADGREPIIFSVMPHLQPYTTGNASAEDEFTEQDLKRRVKQIRIAAGLTDLTEVKEVRACQVGWAEAADGDDGSDVEGSLRRRNKDDRSSEEMLERRVWADLDGNQRELEEKSFEIVMLNGLVIKLRAYSPETMKEWVLRLGDLVRYWKLRLQENLQAHVNVEKANENKLYLVDEEHEGRDPELFYSHLDCGDSLDVTVDPFIWNYCLYTGCRGIAKSGIMYKKLALNSTFTKSIFILTRDGHLLLYRYYDRESFSGAAVKTATHDLEFSVNMRNCYVYSGRPTIDDLTYTSQNNRNHNFEAAGYQHIPRVFADGLTTNDDDESCSFSIFKSRRREFHNRIMKKAIHLHGGLNLGSRGTIYVFRARSRQEKEEWVAALNIVIERLVREETAEIHYQAWKKRRVLDL